jgi:hypothetical protein
LLGRSDLPTRPHGLRLISRQFDVPSAGRGGGDLIAEVDCNMPFRWFQFYRLLWPIPFALAALNFLHVRYELARSVGLCAIFVVVALGAGGVLLALVFLFTGVRFRCPFCRRWGSGAIEKRGLPWMECESCGTIRCEGVLGLRAVREP